MHQSKVFGNRSPKKQDPNSYHMTRTEFRPWEVDVMQIPLFGSHAIPTKSESQFWQFWDYWNPFIPHETEAP